MKCQGFQRSLALQGNVPEAVALEAGDKKQGSRWGHRHSCHHNSRPQIQDSHKGGGRPLPCRLEDSGAGKGGGPAVIGVASVSGLLSLLHFHRPPAQHGKWGGGHMPKP